MSCGTVIIKGAAPETRTSRRRSCGRATASRRTVPVRTTASFNCSRRSPLNSSETRVVPPTADFSTGCKDRQNMAMGAAAAVVVVLLVLYFSLGGSSAEPERIVLTRG